MPTFYPKDKVPEGLLLQAAMDLDEKSAYEFLEEKGVVGNNYLVGYLEDPNFETLHLYQDMLVRYNGRTYAYVRYQSDNDTFYSIGSGTHRTYIDLMYLTQITGHHFKEYRIECKNYVSNWKVDVYGNLQKYVVSPSNEVFNITLSEGQMVCYSVPYIAQHNLATTLEFLQHTANGNRVCELLVL